MQPRSFFAKANMSMLHHFSKSFTGSQSKKDTFQDSHLCLSFLWWYPATISVFLFLCVQSISYSLFRFRWKNNNKTTVSCAKWKLKGFGYRSFSVQTPLVWNSLPPHIRHSRSLSQFKTSLKTFLFTSAFSELPWFLRRFEILPLIDF